jgi:DNA-binding XRE family transcriptional regulator
VHIGNVIAQVREDRKIPRTKLGKMIHLSPRTIEAYETEKQVPSPDTVLAISKCLKLPWLTQIHCKWHCAIGDAYSYEVLTGVNLDPATVLLKLVGEMAEAQAVLGRMLEITVNKNSRECFTEVEWAEFTRCLQEFLDVEHNVECLKITLGQWCDVSELISQHNLKCKQRGYIRKNNERRRPA